MASATTASGSTSRSRAGTNSDGFLYWFDTEDRSLHYFANAHPGGLMPRLRVATIVRDVGGLRLQDYDNFANPGGGARDIDSLVGTTAAGR